MYCLFAQHGGLHFFFFGANIVASRDRIRAKNPNRSFARMATDTARLANVQVGAAALYQ
jgi:hypothetical protein